MAKQRVLIVEDEAAIADTLQYALETDSFESVWVASGLEALREVKQGTFGLIILDVGLPDINGFDLLKKIRAIKNIPTLFLTARNDEIDRIVGLEIGADDYVTKPFSPREVVARIKAILRRARVDVADTKPSAVPRHTSFEWNPDAATILFKGTQLKLTKSEYLLLCALIKQPGRVFSRGQLMDAIFEIQHPSEDRAIDTHVKSLRAKLRLLDKNDHSIKTHRGLGYSLDV